VLDLPSDKAKEVADLVSTTDGLIVHFYSSTMTAICATARTSVAQAVGHKPMKEASSRTREPGRCACAWRAHVPGAFHTSGP